VWTLVEVYGDTRLSIDTAGSDFDVVVALYEAPPNVYVESPDLLTNVACEAGGEPRIEWDAHAGRGYYLQVGGRGGDAGTLHATLACEPGPCPPFHDTMERANGLGLPYSFPYAETIDARGATVSPGERTDCGNMGHSVWYAVYANGARLAMSLATEGSDFDTAVAVYDGNYGPDGQPTRIGCDPGGPGRRARDKWALTSDVTNNVQVGGRNGAGGQLSVQADCALRRCPPGNDNANSAWFASPEYVDIQDISGATLEAGEQRPCGNIGTTVWYNLVPIGGGRITISTAGSDFVTAIALYSFEGFSPPGGVAYADCSTTGTLHLTPRAGSGYLVQVGGADGATGQLQLHITCEGDCAPPPQPISPLDGGPGTGNGGQPGGAISGPDTGTGGYLPAGGGRR
jgi:hypothetical protein